MRNQIHTGPVPRPVSGRGEVLALVAAAVWLVGGGLLWWAVPGAVGLVGMVLPLLLLGLAWMQARHLRLMQAEAQAMRRDLDRIARSRRQDPGRPAAAPAPGKAPGRAVEAAGAFPEAPAPSFATRRDHGPGPADGQAQGSLALGAALDAPPPLPVGDFLQALNFPETPDDTDGFRALRRGLKHPQTAPLIQAAQDVLTLLSQNGLYMDDLDPDRPRPELWRRFAEGERGGAIGALGGIRKPEAIERCMHAMREDPVFRDATHHFLRRFDLMLAARTGDLDDAALIRLAETRTARAFMLLGRSAGIFD